MTPNLPIPVYPTEPHALLVLLLEWEKARLLGPTLQMAVVNDTTPDRQAEAAMDLALGQLEAAEAWVNHKARLTYDNLPNCKCAVQ